MKNGDALAIVIDDDPSVRDGLASLLKSVGIGVEVYASGADFLAGNTLLKEQRPRCIILDVRLPGRSGLDVQAELAKRGLRIPVIFITGHGDIPMSVRAIKAGAIEFLTKPFREQELLDAVYEAVARDRQYQDEAATALDLRARYEALTEREQMVFAEVVSGRPNKQIAARLGVSEITIKVHRGRVMKKMRTRTLADLVRMAALVGPKRGPALD